MIFWIVLWALFNATIYWSNLTLMNNRLTIATFAPVLQLSTFIFCVFLQHFLSLHNQGILIPYMYWCILCHWWMGIYAHMMAFKELAEETTIQMFKILYFLTNIPIPSRHKYMLNLLQKTEESLARMTWKALFSLYSVTRI